MKELCSITPKLNVSEKNREVINLCHMILIELFVRDEFVKKELYDVVTMTMTYMEKRENKLKQDVKIANERADAAEKELNNKNRELNNKNRELDSRNNLLKEIVSNMDSDGKLNQSTMKKLLSIISKL